MSDHHTVDGKGNPIIVTGASRHQHWLAHAPAGRWTYGPSVLTSSDMADKYREMGWDVIGPFQLVPESKTDIRSATAKYADEYYGR